MIDIAKICIGERVHYQPSHYAEDKFENGIVKEIPTFTEGNKEMNTETPMILSDGDGPGRGIVEVYTNKRIAVIDDDEKITFHPSLKLIDVFAYIHARRTVKRLSEWILKGANDAVRVVYNCGGDWDNYKNYTSALTNVRDLKLGWRHKEVKN